MVVAWDCVGERNRKRLVKKVQISFSYKINKD